MRFAAALFGQIYMPSLVGELGAKPTRGSVLVESRVAAEARGLAADASRLELQRLAEISPQSEPCRR
jgi:hypothetical protein